jgi:signal peptidase I
MARVDDRSARADRSPPVGMGGEPLVGRMRLVRRTLALTVVAACIALNANVWLAYSAGWEPSVVVSGSMSPSVRTGDVVLIAPLGHAAVRPGQVVRFRNPNNGPPQLLHRVVDVAADGSVYTRGDANPDEDYLPASRDRVEGVLKLRVPFIGWPKIWLDSLSAHPAQLIALALLCLAAGLGRWRSRRRRRAELVPVAAPSYPVRPPPPGIRRLPVMAWAIAVPAVVGCAAAGSLVWWSTSAAVDGAAVIARQGPWATRVVVADNPSMLPPHAATAVTVTASDALPGGAVIRKCVQLAYRGQGQRGPVRMYATGLDGTGLGAYLDLRIEVLSPSGHSSCSSDTGTTIYHGTFAEFAAIHGVAAALSTTWNPAANGQTQALRMTYSRQNDPNAQSLTCHLSFSWKAPA